VPVLDRKLKAVASKYNKNNFEKNQYSFLSLMCIYGIELLVDNVAECRSNLLEVFSECLNLKPDSLEWAAAKVILDSNIVQGDALSLKDHKNEAIVFPEWSYIGKGFFSRRDLSMTNCFNSHHSGKAHFLNNSRQRRSSLRSRIIRR
jgi:hypothetical protein